MIRVSLRTDLFILTLQTGAAGTKQNDDASKERLHRKLNPISNLYATKYFLLKLAHALKQRPNE